jgi:polyferredoxin
MSRPEDSRRDDAEPRGDEPRGDHATAERGRADRGGDYLAESTLRVSLAVVGFVLLLFALGQAIGIDLLGTIGRALSSQIGRWLVVAFFAILLIALAVRGFDRTTE